MKDNYEKMKTHTSQTMATHAEPFTSFMRATSKATQENCAPTVFRCGAAGGGAAAVRGQSALDGFDPNADNTVRVVVVQPDGKTLIGGNFSTVLGVARSRIARLNADGTLDTAFNPTANNEVDSIAVQPDGKILVGGNFSNIGGQPRTRIARLDPVTGLADSWNPGADNLVESIVVQADGKVLAGGFFLNIGGQSRNRIARLDAVTGLADSFDPNANNVVYSIAVQQDGKVLAGGDFSTLTPNGGAAVTRNSIARLETNGLLDRTLNLGAGGSFFVFATAIQPDGKILIGGSFSTVLGVTRNNIARLNTDGTLDTTFNPNADSDVYAIAVQADGKILVGGFFSEHRRTDAQSHRPAEPGRHG